jgi:hypothetical protein
VLQRKTEAFPVRREWNYSQCAFQAMAICAGCRLPEYPVATFWGPTMRNGPILLGAIFAVGMTTAADAAKK